MRSLAATVLLTAVLTCSALPVRAATIEPAPSTYVDDRAFIIDRSTEQRLIGLLQELEQKTGARMIVVTVGTTNGQDIHSFAFDRADTWKFGPKRKSASVLLLIADADRKYSIQVGYDYEAVLPDGFVGQVGRDYIVGNFRAGNKAKGALETAAVLAATIADARGVTLTGMPQVRRPRRRLSAWGAMAPLLIFFCLAVIGGRRRRGGLFWGVMIGSMMGGRGGGRGGGFGGGGFGSFGGGGGGGFGGGGASGGW